MKTLASLAFLSTTLTALAQAPMSRISLVKGSPTNYGPYGFDISWVDNSTQKYYLADRTNNAVDLVDAATDTFLGFIGKGQYTGSRPCPPIQGPAPLLRAQWSHYRRPRSRVGWRWWRQYH